MREYFFVSQAACKVMNSFTVWGITGFDGHRAPGSTTQTHVPSHSSLVSHYSLRGLKTSALNSSDGVE